MWFECCDLEGKVDDPRVSKRLELLCQAVNKSSSMIVITDPVGNIIFVNPKFTEVTGYEREEAVGENMNILNSGRQSQEFYEEMWETIQAGKEWRGEFCNRRKSGEIYWAHTTISPINDDSGEISHYICIQEDFTERHNLRQELRKTNRRLAKEAKIDALTELPNRRYFDEIYQRELAHVRRFGGSLSLLMIDIDYFKNYNDAFGHTRGDECLQKLAELIDRNLVRSNDFVARYGGEEFVVILPGTDRAGAQQVADRIRLAVEAAEIEHPDSECADVVTVSIGAASYEAEDYPDYDLLEEADAALYSAKKEGRNRVCAVSADRNY